MSEPEDKGQQVNQANRRKRSIALGLVLGAIVVVFYILTVVKIGPGVLQRPL